MAKFILTLVVFFLSCLNLKANELDIKVRSMLLESVPSTMTQKCLQCGAECKCTNCNCDVKIKQAPAAINYQAPQVNYQTPTVSYQAPPQVNYQPQMNYQAPQMNYMPPQMNMMNYQGGCANGQCCANGRCGR